jgi:hypothetical protein
MEKIFTENGIPTNYVKLYYPDDNYLYSVFDERKTRMYISAEMQHFNNLELKCEEPTSEKEVILYGIWLDTNKNKGNKPSGVKKMMSKNQIGNWMRNQVKKRKMIMMMIMIKVKSVEKINMEIVLMMVL